jgi:hypothetical protein
MKPLPQPLRRTDLRRMALAFTTLGCALAWGLVELLALQRHRLHGLHRGRFRQLPPPPPQR